MIRHRKHHLILGMRQGLYVAILSVFLMSSGCDRTTGPTGPDTPEPPIDVTDFKPQPIIEIVRILPFEVKQSFKYDWRLDLPEVRSGLLAVFKVDPKLVTPRNALEPVLYAGNQTVQRLNHGHESGFVIGIIPEQIDLSKEPIWFGTPALPERINAKVIANQRSKATSSGIAPLSSTDIKSITLKPIVADNLTMVIREQAADLVLEFSPQEKALADAWRLPVMGK